MNCPLCDKPMVVFELQGVELDHCVRCNGTWLDVGELELLLDGPASARNLMGSMSPDPQAGEARRRCPICEQPMHKVTYACGDAGHVTLDKCQQNDGVWFDDGELTDILKMEVDPCDGDVHRLLQGIFGRPLEGDR